MRRALPPFPSFSSSESGSAMRALFVLPVAALALAACGPADVEVDGTAVPASRHIESSTVAPPPVEPARIDPYVTTVDVVDEVIREVAADEGIILPAGMGSQYADIVCTAFDDGLPFPLVVAIAADELDHWTPEQHAFLVGASVGASCPEWAGVITGGAA